MHGKIRTTLVSFVEPLQRRERLERVGLHSSGYHSPYLAARSPPTTEDGREPKNTIHNHMENNTCFMSFWFIYVYIAINFINERVKKAKLFVSFTSCYHMEEAF